MCKALVAKLYIAKSLQIGRLGGTVSFADDKFCFPLHVDNLAYQKPQQSSISWLGMALAITEVGWKQWPEASARILMQA